MVVVVVAAGTVGVSGAGVGAWLSILLDLAVSLSRHSCILALQTYIHTYKHKVNTHRVREMIWTEEKMSATHASLVIVLCSDDILERTVRSWARSSRALLSASSMVSRADTETRISCIKHSSTSIRSSDKRQIYKITFHPIHQSQLILFQKQRQSHQFSHVTIIIPSNEM